MRHDPSTTSLQYAAAVLDSEGCITAHKGRSGIRRPGLTIAQRHPELLERFMRAVGTGYIHLSPNIQGKPLWTYHAFGWKHLRVIMPKLWPYLGIVKKKQFASVVKKCNEGRN
jgi:hypothetical protein